jgi:hypothetical protein
MESVILGRIMALGLVLGFAAQAVAETPACSYDKWNGDTPSVPVDAVGSPQSVPAVARFSEYCGLAVSAAGYVQSPATSDGHYFGRFYVHPQSGISGTVDILVAYKADDSPLFTISYDGSAFLFDSVAGGNGTASANPGKWNLVEFEFNSGGDFNVWVNGDWDFVNSTYTSSPSDTFLSGTGAVGYVRLGALSALTGGTLTFDAYEAHRTTNVGALVVGDANGSGSVSGLDLVVIKNEILKKPTIVPTYLSKGQADCNLSGSVSGLDLVCTKNIILGK